MSLRKAGGAPPLANHPPLIVIGRLVLGSPTTHGVTCPAEDAVTITFASSRCPPHDCRTRRQRTVVADRYRAGRLADPPQCAVATRADAEAGWGLFRGSDYSLSLSEVNGALKRSGFSPISPRTYQHYRKLQRYGFTRYIPINQLDVKTLQDPFVDEAAKSRHLPRPFRMPARLRVFDRERVYNLEGESVELSENEVVVVLRGSDAVTLFERLGTARRAAEVVFPDSGEIRLGKVERLTLDVDEQRATVRLDFSVPVDVPSFTRRRVSTGDLLDWRAVIPHPASPPFTEVARYVYWLHQALDASTSAVVDLAGQLFTDESVEVARPRVRSITLSSPLDLVVALPVPAAVVFLTALRAYVAIRKSYWDSEKTKQEALALRWENEQKKIRGRLDLDPLVMAVTRVLRRHPPRMQASDSDRPLNTDRAKAIIEKQVIDSTAQLVENVDGQLSFESVDPLPEGLEDDIDEVVRLMVRALDRLPIHNLPPVPSVGRTDRSEITAMKAIDPPRALPPAEPETPHGSPTSDG